MKNLASNICVFFLLLLVVHSAATGAECGNNAIEPGEECDGPSLNGMDCTDFEVVGRPGEDYHGGTLLCDPDDCTFDFSHCEYCGDTHINGDESCDSNNLNGFTCVTLPKTNFASGRLGCDDDCEFDTGACSSCNNGIIDPGEECDGDLLNGKTCENLYSFPMIGTLTCSDKCHFDDSECSLCGNGIIDYSDGEQCDTLNLGGKTCENVLAGKPMLGELKCSHCLYDISKCNLCGNGQLDEGEECEEDHLDGKSCYDVYDDDRFIGGTLKCNEDKCVFDTSGCISPECGDGKREGNEECDGDDFGYHRCETVYGGIFYGGKLRCTDECKFDTSHCLSLCGNGVLDKDYEECDTKELDGKTCETLKGYSFTGGVLRCNEYCFFDVSACYPEQKNPSDDDRSGGACFSGETVVSVLGRGPVQMKDLQVNDKVYSGTTSEGITRYQTVYSFGHLDRDTETEYLQIFHSKTSKTELPVEISASHLMFLADTVDPIRADKVQKGDRLRFNDSDDEAITVTKIAKVLRKGAYLPLTQDGTLVVNGLAVSAYVSINHESPAIVSRFGLSEQKLVHWWLSPYRMVCIGVHSRLCEHDFSEKDGIIHWLHFGEWLALFGERQTRLVQVIGVGLVAVILLIFVVAEAMLGPRLGLIGLVVGSFFVMRRMLFQSQSIQLYNKEKPTKKVTKPWN